MRDRMRYPFLWHSSPRIDDPRFGDEDPPVMEIHDLGGAPGRRASVGEVQIESGGQQKAVADQPIGRVKCGIVEHLKIQRAMGGASGMETVGCDREGNLASPRLGQNDVRLKQ